MALYAANNINTAVANFADRSYAKVRGILLNRRNVPDEEAKVRAFAEKAHLSIVGDIPAATTSTAMKIWARPSSKAIRTCLSAISSSIWPKNYYKTRNDYDRTKTLCYHRAGPGDARPR